MPRIAVLTAMLVAVPFATASDVRAGELIRALHRLIHPSYSRPSGVGYPPQTGFAQSSYPAPGPFPYPHYASPGHPPTRDPRVGVPAYDWGYFGARDRGAVWNHKGYYGDVYHYGCRPGH